MLLAVSVCVTLYMWRHPAGLSLRYGTLLGVIFGVTLVAARMVVLEREFSVRVPPNQTCTPMCLVIEYASSSQLMVSSVTGEVSTAQGRPLASMIPLQSTSTHTLHRASCQTQPYTLDISYMNLQAVLCPERDLADPDSLFHSISGTEIHYKCVAAPAPPRGDAATAVAMSQVVNTFQSAAGRLPDTAAQTVSEDAALSVACYHGFGANSFSWASVQRQLSQRLGATVVAHDMPGFGLTQRYSYALDSQGLGKAAHPSVGLY